MSPTEVRLSGVYPHWRARSLSKEEPPGQVLGGRAAFVGASAATSRSRRIVVREIRSSRDQSPKPLRKTLNWVHGARTSTQTPVPAGIELTLVGAPEVLFLIATVYVAFPSPPDSIASSTA